MKRKKKKNIGSKLLILIVAALMIYTFIYFFGENKSKLILLGYNRESVKIIEKYDLSKITLKNNYSKTLDKAIEKREYKKEYLTSYIKIKYIKKDNFIKNVNRLLDLKYSENEINKIFSSISETSIEYLLTLKYEPKLFDYIDRKFFKVKYLNRYISYEKKNNYSKDKVIMYVNIGLDYKFYTHISDIEDPYDKLVIVNKYNALPKNFEPKNLITIPKEYGKEGLKMEKIAAEAIISLIDNAKNEGYYLQTVSGYRTESYQSGLYNNSIKKNGLAHAEIYSAHPRHSEHQTGLAIDISKESNIIDNFEKEKEYNWVKANAHKYGFIERYPKGKEYITGYAYEPWHYRYVGIEVATIIKNEQITFEEYCVKYLNY